VRLVGNQLKTNFPERKWQMLTKNDLKEIKNLLKPLETGQKKLEEELHTNTSSTLKIERDIKTALELRTDVKQTREKVADHEERISSLEKF